jgi:hypothetical protein
MKPTSEIAFVLALRWQAQIARLVFEFVSVKTSRLNVARRSSAPDRLT